MRISLSQRSTHIIALVGGIFFLFSVVAYGLFLREIKHHKSHLHDTQVTYLNFEKHKDAYTALIHKLDETSDDRSSLRSRILTEENVIDFLALIEAVGREQGVLLETTAVAVQPIDVTFETLVVSVKVKGQYSALVQTLTLFEQLPYQLTLSGVQFVRTSEGNIDQWESTYNIQVTKFKAYAN